MKTFIKRFLLGCLGLFLVGIVILAVTAGVMLSLGPPERNPENRTESQAVETPRLPPAVRPSPGEVAIPPVSLVVELHLREGRFEVLRGEPGSDIRIEADYDSGIYALEQERSPGGAGVEKVKISFQSRYSIFRRLLTMGDVDPDNHIKIYLPPDVPIELTGSIKMGESELDLTGIALTGLDMNLEMGEHAVTADEPNPLGMDELRLYVSKGEFRSKGLGNLGYRKAHISGSMGEVGVDLRGAYSGDATASTRFRMGEMTVTLPSDIHVDLEGTSVFLGEKNVSRRRDEAEVPEDAPTLRVKSSLSMGELRFRYR